MEPTNVVSVAGRLHSLSLSHKIYGEAFYTFYLECTRLSEQTDVLPVTISERLLCRHPLCEGMSIGVKGQLRSYNKLEGGRVRLCLTIFARDIEEETAALNEISMTWV